MLREETRDGVCTLQLDRPDRGNALGADLVEALLAAVQAAFGDGAVHTLRLGSTGRHFCTGFDLSDLDAQTDGSLLHRLVRIETLLATLWHAPIRTVVVAPGRSWGAGADLFAVCDVRIASPDAGFRFPGAGFGIVLGTRRLAERIGAERARECACDGRALSAEDALACGLATRLQNGAEHSTVEAPVVDRGTVAALRAASRADHRDADLAALVRSAAHPGLRARIAAYRERQARKTPPT